MMTSLVEKALGAKRESKSVDFKQGFDCDSKGDWCEVIKDLVAMANSGGGIVVFGLGNTGEPVGFDCTRIAALDPADVANKIGPYIASSNFGFSIVDVKKGGLDLVAFLVEAAATPYVFERPGSYTDSLGKPKSAFALGTTYFRHNAKSEPGTNEDLRKSISRQVEQIRKEWTDGLRKVVEAPAGSKVQIVQARSNAEPVERLSSVRAVSDQSAQPIHITRDPSIATTGTFLHEVVSEDLVKDVNNVVDVNRFLFPGRDRFLMGTDVYFRIYAERQKISQTAQELDKLYLRGLADYFPFLYWCTLLPDDAVAARLAALVLSPRGKEAYSLPRILPLLGASFYQWILAKFHKRWRTYSQPPSIYWKVQKVGDYLDKVDPRMLASGMGPSSNVLLPGDRGRLLSEVLEDQAYLDEVISQACLKVFDGDKDWVGTSRDFDYLANGKPFVARSESIGLRIQEIVGDRLPNTDGTPEKSDDL